ISPSRVTIRGKVCASAMPAHMSTTTFTVAAIQCPLGGSRQDNVARVEGHVRDAAKKGANVILPSELFEGPYFCREEKETFFSWARPFEGSETIARFASIAK